MIKANFKKLIKVLLLLLCVLFIVVVARVFYVRYTYDISLQEKVGFVLAEWKLHWLLKIKKGNEIVLGSLDDSTFIELQTTGCHGYCPEYKMFLFGDGKVEFEGRKNICRLDKFVANIDKKIAYDLINSLVLIDFFNLESYENIDITDSSSINIGLTLKSKKHVIVHYGGDLSVPYTLKLIEKDILNVVKSLAVFGEYTPVGLKCRMQDGVEKVIPWS